MRRHDYVPAKDIKFSIWQENLLKHVEDNHDAWDIPV